MIDFDGPNLTITLEAGVTTVDAGEIYSRWKDWVVQSDNAKFLEAFRVIGGDPLGGGLSAGSYFFLQNQYGWRIKPPEEDIVITITGNIFAENPASPIFNATTSNFNTSIRLQTSSLTQVVSVAESNDLTQLTADVDYLRKLLANRVSVSSDDSVTTIFDDDGTTELLVFDHSDERNRAPR